MMFKLSIYVSIAAAGNSAAAGKTGTNNGKKSLWKKRHILWIFHAKMPVLQLFRRDIVR
jgi:hypothetical protein